MATFSIIPYSRLERAKRIDAKYYQPQYLALEKLYQSGVWQPIQRFLALCEYGISIKMNVEGEGYKIFRMDDIKNGFAFDYEMKYAPISQDEFERFKLKKDDILFNRVNSEEFVGRTGIYKLDGEYTFASYLIRLRTNSLLKPDVLNLFLNSKYGRLSIQRLSRRAVNQANVNAQELRSILMPVFSSELQDALTNLSNMSWTLYKEAEQTYEQAEKLLLSELGITGWQPRHILTYTGSYHAAIHSRRLDAEHYQPKYGDLRERIRNYPHGYCKIIDIAYNSQEMVSPRETPDRSFQYVELSDINKSIGVIEEAKRILGKESPSRARMVLRAGDVIASSVQGSLDKVALVPDSLDGSVGSTGFFVFRPRTVESGYLLALVKSIVIREQLACEAAGTILAAVPAKNLKNIIVPKIPSSKRREIDGLVRQSHAARQRAKALFAKAKRAVEMAIEEGEEKAMAFLQFNGG